MRAAGVGFCSSAGLAIVALGVPILYPHIDPWVAKLMVGGGLALLAIAFLIWFWGLRRAAPNGVTQSTTGDQSPSFKDIGTVNNFYGPPPAASNPEAPQSADTYNVQGASGGFTAGRIDSLHLGHQPFQLTPQMLTDIEARLGAHRELEMRLEAWSTAGSLDIARQLHQHLRAVGFSVREDIHGIVAAWPPLRTPIVIYPPADGGVVISVDASVPT
jgi:hypothetical protein